MILVFTRDNTIDIVYPHNQTSRKVDHPHEDWVCSGDISKKAIATVGCDGFLNVTEMEGSNPGEAITRTQISDKTRIQEWQRLDCKFNESGDTLAIAGSSSLRLLKAGVWTPYKVESVKSGKELSCLEWISNSVIACSFLDLKTLIYNTKKEEVIYSFTTKSSIKSMKFCNRAGALAYYDFDGCIGVWENSFAEETTIESAEKEMTGLEIEEDINMTGEPSKAPEVSAEPMPDEVMEAIDDAP